MAWVNVHAMEFEIAYCAKSHNVHSFHLLFDLFVRVHHTPNDDIDISNDCGMTSLRIKKSAHAACHGRVVGLHIMRMDLSTLIAQRNVHDSFHHDDTLMTNM